MSIDSVLEMYEEMDGEFATRRTANARLPQASYSPRHERRRTKSAQLRSGAHLRRQKKVRL